MALFESLGTTAFAATLALSLMAVWDILEPRRAVVARTRRSQF